MGRANIDFVTDKAMGIGYANLLRMELIECNVSIKPIAFALSDGGNKFRTSENLIDNLEFSYKLGELEFESTGDYVQFPIIKKMKFKGRLSSNDLKWGDLAVKSDEDITLLECINPDKECEVSIVFDKNKGTVSAETVRDKLSQMVNRDASLDSYSTIRVRFSDCKSGYEINEGYSADKVHLFAEFKNCSDSESEQNVINAIDRIIKKFEEMKKILSN